MQRREYGPLASFVREKQQARFRFLLDIDGNTYSRRFIPMLHKCRSGRSQDPTNRREPGPLHTKASNKQAKIAITATTPIHVLCRRSLVLKASLFEEFERQHVRPFVHFVPVELDPEAAGAGSIEQSLRALSAHDTLAESIATAGHALARRWLRKADLQCYWFRLLLEYHAMQNRSDSSCGSRYRHRTGSGRIRKRNL